MMQHTLEEFLRALRAADVKVSPAEAIDAARTVSAVGYSDRELFKDALCATLAKSRDEVGRFDEAFETFFARDTFTLPPPDEADGGGEEQPGVAAVAAGSNAAGRTTPAPSARRWSRRPRAPVSPRSASPPRSSRLTRRILDEMGLAEIEQIIAARQAAADATRPPAWPSGWKRRDRLFDGARPGLCGASARALRRRLRQGAARGDAGQEGAERRRRHRSRRPRP